jgi:hypothetical protein
MPSRRLLSLVLLLALGALLLQGATVPHTHAGVGPGLYNQDHDLALMATLHGAAVLYDPQPAPLVLSVVTGLAPAANHPPASAPRSTTDSRAPPLA